MALSRDEINRRNKKVDDEHAKVNSELIPEHDRAKLQAGKELTDLARKLLAQSGNAKRMSKGSYEIMKGAESVVREVTSEISKDLAQIVESYRKKNAKLEQKYWEAEQKWLKDSSESNGKVLDKLREAIDDISDDMAREIDYASTQGQKDLKAVEKSVIMAQRLAGTKIGKKLGEDMRKQAIKDIIERKKSFLEQRKEIAEGLANQRDVLKAVPGNEKLLADIEEQLKAVQKKDFEKYSSLEKSVSEQTRSIKDSMLSDTLEQAKAYRRETFARKAFGDLIGGGLENIAANIKSSIREKIGRIETKVGNIGIGPVNLRNAAKIITGRKERRQASRIYDNLSKRKSDSEIIKPPSLSQDALPPMVADAKPSSADSAEHLLDVMATKDTQRTQINELKDINKNLKNIATKTGDAAAAGSGGGGGIVGAIEKALEGALLKKIIDTVLPKVPMPSWPKPSIPVPKPSLPSIPKPGMPGIPPVPPVPSALATAAGFIAPVAIIAATAAAGLYMHRKNTDRLKDLAKTDPNNAELKVNPTGMVLTGRADTQKQAGAMNAQKALKVLQPGTARQYLAAGPDKVTGQYLDGYSKEELDTMAAGKAIAPGTLDRFSQIKTKAQKAATAANPPAMSTLPTAGGAGPISATPSSATPAANVSQGAVITPDITKIADVASGVNVKDLNPAVAKNFQGLATEYTKLTGKKLIVNSAVRSKEKQKSLWMAWLSGKLGANPANAPGTSLHEKGYALDVKPSQVEEMAKLGLLGKYGFERINKPGEAQHIQMAGAEASIASNKIKNRADSVAVASAQSATVMDSAAQANTATASKAMPDNAVANENNQPSQAEQPQQQMSSSASNDSRDSAPTVTASTMSTFSFLDPGMYAINVGAMG